MLAPNHVSAPAAIHTSSMPTKLGTARLTSDGCTKIDEPTMVPTTIAVAWTRPIDRVRAPEVLEGIGGRIVSPCQRFVDGSNGADRVRLGRALVGAVALHARKAQRD